MPANRARAVRRSIPAAPVLPSRLPLTGLALAALALLSPVAAQASDWEVVSMSEPVRVSDDGRWRMLDGGETVRTGAWIKTGTDASVTLRRIGTRTSVTVKPRTMVAVAGLRGDPEATVVLQRWGATRLDAEKRDRPHLQLRTPYLSAVVKGTTLDVVVGRTHADITVETGSVEVRDDVRGAATSLRAGQSATGGLGRRGALDVRGGDGAAGIVAIEPRTPVLPPVGGTRPMTAGTIGARNVAAAELRAGLSERAAPPSFDATRTRVGPAASALRGARADDGGKAKGNNGKGNGKAKGRNK